MLKLLVLYTLFTLSLGCKDPDYLYSLNENSKESGDKVLLILDNDYYVYTKKLYDYMEEMSNLTYFNIDTSEPFDFNLEDFDQIWMFDLGENDPTEDDSTEDDSSEDEPSEGSSNLTRMLDNIIAWFSAHPEKNVIFDSRMICAFDYPDSGSSDFPEKQLIKNYFDNLKMRGGGLMIGTDHGPQFMGTANYLMEKLNFNLFSGSIDVPTIEADPTHPIIFFKTNGYSSEIEGKYFVKGSGSIGQTLPYGLQPNGIMLYNVAYRGAIGGEPHITTSIPPSDFKFEKYFSCEQTLKYTNEWDLGKITKFHSSFETQVRVSSNLVGTFFKTRTYDSIIKTDLPKYPGEHEIRLNLISENEQYLAYVFNVTVELDKEETECTGQSCSCNNGMECNLENNSTLKELNNEGYLRINESTTIKVIYEPNTVIINSTNGVVDIDGGNLVIIINEALEGEIDILVGNYRGKFKEVNIESDIDLKSCEEYNSEINYESKQISVAFSLQRKSCIKWWVYLLIAIGILIVLCGIFLVVVFKVGKLRQRILPFSSQG